MLLSAVQAIPHLYQSTGRNDLTFESLSPSVELSSSAVGNVPVTKSISATVTGAQHPLLADVSTAPRKSIENGSEPFPSLIATVSMS